MGPSTVVRTGRRSKARKPTTFSEKDTQNFTRLANEKMQSGGAA